MSRRIPLIVVSIGVMAVAGSLSGCPRSSVSDLEKRGRMQARTIEQVLSERTDEWMAIPGVTGVAIGEFKGKPCIRIFASAKPQQLRSQIPPTIEGYPVIIEESGPIRALGHED